MGRVKVSEMAFRVMSRDADADSTPWYHAEISVRSRPKAMMAMATPRMVRAVRNLWRKELRRISLRMNIEDALIEMPDQVCVLGGPGVVGDHDDGLAEF